LGGDSGLWTLKCQKGCGTWSNPLWGSLGPASGKEPWVVFVLKRPWPLLETGPSEEGGLKGSCISQARGRREMKNPKSHHKAGSFPRGWGLGKWRKSTLSSPHSHAESTSSCTVFFAASRTDRTEHSRGRKVRCPPGSRTSGINYGRLKTSKPLILSFSCKRSIGLT